MTPISLGELPLVGRALADVLAAPSEVLAQATDKSLHYGRVAIEGTGRADLREGWLLILREGALALEAGGRRVEVVVGQAVVIGPDQELSWDAGAGAICEIVGSARARLAAGVEVLALETALEPSPSPSAEVLLSPTPRCAKADLGDVGALSYGIWAASPYTRRAVPMAVSEVMYLLEGAVMLEDASGGQHHFVAGDAFLCPVGVSLAWSSAVDVRKLYYSLEG